MKSTPDGTTDYQADSLSLTGAIALGTSVMIGTGILALPLIIIVQAAVFLSEKIG